MLTCTFIFTFKFKCFVLYANCTNRFLYLFNNHFVADKARLVRWLPSCGWIHICAFGLVYTTRAFYYTRIDVEYIWGANQANWTAFICIWCKGDKFQALIRGWTIYAYSLVRALPNHTEYNQGVIENVKKFGNTHKKNFPNHRQASSHNAPQSNWKCIIILGCAV